MHSILALLSCIDYLFALGFVVASCVILLTITAPPEVINSSGKTGSKNEHNSDKLPIGDKAPNTDQFRNADYPSL